MYYSTSNGRYSWYKLQMNSIYGMMGTPEHPKEDPFPILTTGDNIYSKVFNTAAKSLEPYYIDGIDTRIESDAVYEIDEDVNIYFYLDPMCRFEVAQYENNNTTLPNHYYYDFNERQMILPGKERLEDDYFKNSIHRRTEQEGRVRPVYEQVPHKSFIS